MDNEETELAGLAVGISDSGQVVLSVVSSEGEYQGPAILLNPGNASALAMQLVKAAERALDYHMKLLPTASPAVN